jgi:hypothetical protein
MEPHEHNIRFLNNLEPLQQQSMSNEAVATLNEECTLDTGSFELKFKSLKGIVDRTFREVWHDLSRDGAKRTSRDQSLLHRDLDTRIEPYDEGGDVNLRALAVLLAVRMFEMHRQFLGSEQRLESERQGVWRRHGGDVRRAFRDGCPTVSQITATTLKGSLQEGIELGD